MQSFLVTGQEEDAPKNFALNFLKEKKVDKFDITLIEEEKAVGIGVIREFQKKIFLKPMGSENKAVILNASDGITIEAQNSLLKILEEPPNNTYIFILSKNKDGILPTILSRAKTIELKKSKVITNEEISESKELLDSVLSMAISKKLKLAQNLSKDKKNSLAELEKFITAGRERLYENPNKKNSQVVRTLVKTHTVIKSTNTNLRLTLENLFLNI